MTIPAARKEMREKFLSQKDFFITIVAEGEPLWPHGFDPMNVQVLDDKEVLHTRWVRLGNRGSSLEVLDRWSLTEAAGNHPLFGGIRRITVRGLPGKPQFTMVGGTLKVEADGFTGEFADAVLDASEESLLVTLQ